jgi:hypothetical protein
MARELSASPEGVSLPMTLQELINETLVAKNRRLRQEKCRHAEVYCSSVTGEHGHFENRFCLDCGKNLSPR